MRYNFNTITKQFYRTICLVVSLGHAIDTISFYAMTRLARSYSMKLNDISMDIGLQRYKHYLLFSLLLDGVCLRTA